MPGSPQDTLDPFQMHLNRIRLSGEGMLEKGNKIGPENVSAFAQAVNEGLDTVFDAAIERRMAPEEKEKRIGAIMSVVEQMAQKLVETDTPSHRMAMVGMFSTFAFFINPSQKSGPQMNMTVGNSSRAAETKHTLLAALSGCVEAALKQCMHSRDVNEWRHLQRLGEVCPPFKERLDFVVNTTGEYTHTYLGTQLHFNKTANEITMTTRMGPDGKQYNVISTEPTVLSDYVDAMREYAGLSFFGALQLGIKRRDICAAAYKIDEHLFRLETRQPPEAPEFAADMAYRARKYLKLETISGHPIKKPAARLG